MAQDDDNALFKEVNIVSILVVYIVPAIKSISYSSKMYWLKYKVVLAYTNYIRNFLGILAGIDVYVGEIFIKQML